MEREFALDLINIFNALAISLAQVVFNALQYPISVQVLPSILIIVPLVIAWYRRRIKVQKIERQKFVQKARKLQPLLVKLGR